jgi:hypothetical protein
MLKVTFRFRENLKTKKRFREPKSLGTPALNKVVKEFSTSETRRISETLFTLILIPGLRNLIKKNYQVLRNLFDLFKFDVDLIKILNPHHG